MALQAQLGLDASIGIVLPELTARLEGAIAAQAAITLQPPTLAANLSAALGLVAQLEAAITMGLPGVGIDLSVMASIIAEIQLSLGQLQAQLAFSASLGLTLGASGIYAYKWMGPAGEAVPSGLPGLPADGESFGVFLVTGSSGSWTALQAMFGL